MLTDKERSEYRDDLKIKALASVTLNAHYNGDDIYESSKDFMNKIEEGYYDPDGEAMSKAIEEGSVVVPVVVEGEMVMSNLETSNLETSTDEELVGKEFHERIAKEVRDRWKAVRGGNIKVEKYEEDEEGQMTRTLVSKDAPKGGELSAAMPDSVLEKVDSLDTKELEEEVSITPQSIIGEQIKVEKSKKEIFEAKLELAGVTKEEAWEIIDTMMLQNKPYRRVYQILGNFSVELKTRDGGDIASINEKLEQSAEESAMSGITLSYLTWRQNLAASICRYGDTRMDDWTVEARIEWACNLQEAVYTLLLDKLRELDQLVAAVFSKDFMSNF